MTQLADRRWLGQSSSPTVVAIIEARMTSTRLPGKVLADVSGVPLLTMMIRRVRGATTLDEVCVATTTNGSDDAVEAAAIQAGASCFRGSELDVLGRVVGAAKRQGADVVVELTGDCPLIDSSVIDECVHAYLVNDVHFSSNVLDRTFPRGLDVTVVSADLLDALASETLDHADREHVSLHLYEHPHEYRSCNVAAAERLRHPEWRWTVDTPADLEFVRVVVENLGHAVTAGELATFLAHREDIVGINSHVRQKPVR